MAFHFLSSKRRKRSVSRRGLSTTHLNRRRLNLEKLEDRQLLSANEIITVPFSQEHLELPHLAHEEAQITLKAIIRDATSGSGYEIAWDTDRDGDYSDEVSRVVQRNGSTNSVRDIGQTFLVPTVAAEGRLDINVRAINLLDNTESFGTFKLYVYDWRPSNDPLNWTDFQIDVMNSMAIQENMWYLHRQAVGFIGRDSATMSARSGYQGATAAALEVFVSNGHQPAYPPGTIDDFGQTLPSGWESLNDARFSSDPYAETTLRFMNSILANSQIVGISGGEEGNLVGYNPNGSERSVNRIAGTADLRGIRMTTYSYAGDSGDASMTGQGVAALVQTLPALQGTLIQAGPQSGREWNWFIQQAVDYIGAAQIDGGAAKGSWWYTPVNGSRSSSFDHAEQASWAHNGLQMAELHGTDFGIAVTNRHKYRIAEQLVRNQRSNGGAVRSQNLSGSNLNFTGGSLRAAQWLGIHTFSSADNTVAFPQYSGYTRARLRESWDRYVAFSSNEWTSRNRVGAGTWLDGFWQNGDYLVGNRNAIYNAGRAGNTYAQYFFATAYDPTSLVTIGSHDIAREFSTYFTRSQDRFLNANDPLASYSNFGRTKDDYCTRNSWTCVFGPGHWSTALAGVAMTNLANPFWLADFSSASTAGVPLSLDLDASITGHLAYQWDFDPVDGLWWETGATADAQGENTSHIFQAPGDYSATLRVVKQDGSAIVHSKTVTVEPPPATILDITLAGTNWASGFLDAVDGGGSGAGNGLGYSLVGAHQLETTPWAGADKLYVQFSTDVSASLDAGDFTLLGTNGGTYAFTLLPYGQDGTNVATILLGQAIDIDSLVLSIDAAGVQNATGDLLDGEWTSGQAVSSGDGTAGGQFDFFFNVLPGDVDASDQVTVTDAFLAFASDTAATTELLARKDIDASGQITATDAFAAFAKNTFGLPAQPVPPAPTLAVLQASVEIDEALDQLANVELLASLELEEEADEDVVLASPISLRGAYTPTARGRITPVTSSRIAYSFSEQESNALALATLRVTGHDDLDRNVSSYDEAMSEFDSDEETVAVTVASSRSRSFAPAIRSRFSRT